MVIIKKTKKYGRGCYTNKLINKNSLIFSNETIELDNKDTNGIQKTNLKYYVYNSDNNGCMISLGYGSLINHSKKPNVEAFYDERTKTLNFYALSNIKKGDQLFIDYGYDIQ